MSENTMVAPELASIEVKGMTREAFMVRGAIAAGAVYGASAAGPFVREALAQGGDGDLKILNFALTLEYLEAAFYAQALDKVKGLDSELKKVVTVLRDSEDEHVKALQATIKQAGGTAVKAPGVDFGDSFSSKDAFLETAQTFEDLGVGAYNGAAPMIKSKEILGAAGSIVQVEGRHAGVIRLLRGEKISPSAFDKALEETEVLDAAKPFLK